MTSFFTFTVFSTVVLPAVFIGQCAVQCNLPCL